VWRRRTTEGEARKRWSRGGGEVEGEGDAGVLAESFFFYYNTYFKTLLSNDTFNLNFSIIVFISAIIL
jgi:hypothetical protein